MPPIRKKLTVFVAVVALMLLDSWFDLGLGEEHRRGIMILAVTYLIGQGIADAGKGSQGNGSP